MHRQPTASPISVQLPDGSTIVSTHQCHLPLPHLPPAATAAHIFPDLKDHALLSIGTFCDNGCTAEFTKTDVTISHKGQPVLHGQRSNNGLWHTTIDHPKPRPPTLPTANFAMTSSTTADLIKFLHAACFSPPKTSWIKAIDNGHFTTWPALTSAAVRRHLPNSTMATAMGHLDQQRQNTRSTKPVQVTKPKTTEQPADHDITATPPCPNGERTDLVFPDIVLVGNTPTGAIHTDQTGRLPVQSSNGYQYLMILYDYDSNAILAAPMKNRTGPEILRTYRELHATLVAKGLRPRLQRLDNEASRALKAFLRDEDIDFQLVPPHMHRRNAAERAIRTFKNHFIAGLASTDPLFPLHLWDRILPQAVTSLNLLRQSRINPKLSAYAQLYGNFDFNRTPMAPPGTRVLAHNKPSNRASWAPHGDAGWYIGPAMEHYRCYRVHITRTNAERISDTVEFFPSQVAMPQLSSQDTATHAAQDLIAALQKPHPAGPFPNIGDQQLEALRQLAAIFQKRTGPPNLSPAPSPRVPQQSPPMQPWLPTVMKGPWTPFPDTTPATAPFTPQPMAQAHAARSQPTPRLPTTLPTQATPETPLTTLFDGIHNHPNSPLSAHAVIDPKTGKSMEYRDLLANPATKAVWQRSAANEFGRCAQGVGNRVKGTNTIRFIHKSDVPAGRNVTYARFVCTLRPQKKEIERTRLTVGGNLLTYPGDTSAPTADLTTFKCLVNSTLSTPNAKMGCADIKNFYLNTPMDRSEYMKIPLHLIPAEIQQEYHLDKLVSNGHVYVSIDKGMYGLPQAGMLANKLLQKRLAKHGYYQCRHTPGLWKHTFRPIQFTLVVDDLAFEYVGREHADHLLNILHEHYEGISVDWDASLYCGISLKWDYVHRTCDLSMPKYIPAALDKFSHQLPPTKPQHSPHRHNEPQYGVKVQLTEPIDDSPLLPPEDKTRIQQIIGTLLYYARAVDPTLLVSLSALASAQSRATQKTAQAVNQLLDYCATHPNATIRYRASDMLLLIHSDASYLNEPPAKSRAGGHLYLGNAPDKPPISNGAILNPTGILRHVASSATEAEVGALFVNLKEGAVIRQMLHDLGYPQPTTPVQTDNSTANGIANGTIKQQRSRAMDMRYYWIQDRSRQGHYRIYWAPGSTNLADYFTKHHSATHHQAMRPHYLHQPKPEPTPHRSNIARLHCEGVLNACPTSARLGTRIAPMNSNRLFKRRPLLALERAHDSQQPVTYA